MDKLPKEVLIEIFAFLNMNDLCELTLTCKLFNEIISNSSILLDKFHLLVDDCDIIADFWMRKKYRKIKVKNVDEFLIGYLEIYGDNIVDIKIQCEEVELQDLRRIFTFCPNLKQLNIEIIKLTYSDDDLTDPVMNLTLNSLTINNFDSKIFELLQISARNINVSSTRFDSLIKNALFNLLKSQKHLKTLQLGVHGSKLFDDDALVNVDFQLQALIADHFLFDNSSSKNLKKFLKNQNSLVKIIDGNNYIMSFGDCDYAKTLGHFKNIKELKVPGPYNFSNSMPYVENLAIKIPHFNNSFRNIHNLFPNVNYLSICSYRQFKFVNNFTESGFKVYVEIKLNENVKTLTMDSVEFRNDSLFDDDVDIKIENLSIICSDNINWLIDCFKNDRMKLKSLTIDRTNMKKSQREYLESVTQGENKKIEKLKVYMPMKFNENRDYVCDYLIEDD